MTNSAMARYMGGLSSCLKTVSFLEKAGIVSVTNFWEECE